MPKKVKTDYDELTVQVYSRKAKRLPEKDFTLKFQKSKLSKKDITKRFDRYFFNGYNEYFSQYLIPTVIKDTFITSTTVSPYKALPPKTIIAFERPHGEQGMKFQFGDYEYTKEGNEFNVRYVGENTKEITTYPFGGFSEFKVNYDSCYAGTHIKSFDFKNLMMDYCVSTDRMFFSCSSLRKVLNFAPHLYKIPLRSMNEMFAYCVKLKTIDLSELNQSFNILSVQRMFYACMSLRKIDITGLKLSGKYSENAEENSLFAYCYNLREVVCLKDQLLSIRPAFPMPKLWVDKREYLKLVARDDEGKHKTVAKKTHTIEYINTFFTHRVVIENLDNERSKVLVRNKMFESDKLDEPEKRTKPEKTDKPDEE